MSQNEIVFHGISLSNTKAYFALIDESHEEGLTPD